MGFTVSVDLGGLDQLVNNLRTAHKDLSKTETLAKRVAEVMKLQIYQRFGTKIAPSGYAWAPWAPSTAAARASTPGASLLVLTGALRDSLSVKADNSGVTIHLGADYASFHEDGTEHMPPRPMVLAGGRLGPQDQDEINHALQERINEILGVLR